MIERDCACERFKRLEGTAMQIYLADLLELLDAHPDTTETWYRCRRCDALWKQKGEAGVDKVWLVRVAAESNV